MVICLKQGAADDLHNGPVGTTATPSSLAVLKSRMVYLSSTGLPRMSWKSGH